jgi:hypothetical protein
MWETGDLSLYFKGLGVGKDYTWEAEIEEVARALSVPGSQILADVIG